MRRILLSLSTLVFLSALASAAFAAEITLVKADPDAKIAYTGPVWSPNGKTIAYVGAPYTTDPNEPTTCKMDASVYVATLSGGKWNSRVLAKNSDWPVWAADGKKVAVSHAGLATVDAAKGKIAQVTKASAGVDYPMLWSPNGRFIVHASEMEGAFQPMIRDTKAGKDISQNIGFEGAWMPDGKLLTAMCTESDEVGANWLKIVDPASGNARTVAKDTCIRNPFIQKGGRYALIRITRNAPKGEGIYGVDLKTSTLSKVIAVRAKEFFWSPDGQQFAFFANYSPKAGVEVISALYVGNTQNWAFKIASKEAAKTDDTLHAHAQWSPDSKSIAYVTDAGDIRVMKP